MSLIACLAHFILAYYNKIQLTKLKIVLLKEGTSVQDRDATISFSIDIFKRARKVPMLLLLRVAGRLALIYPLGTLAKISKLSYFLFFLVFFGSPLLSV